MALASPRSPAWTLGKRVAADYAVFQMLAVRVPCRDRAAAAAAVAARRFFGRQCRASRSVTRCAPLWAVAFVTFYARCATRRWPTRWRSPPEPVPGHCSGRGAALSREPAPVAGHRGWLPGDAAGGQPGAGAARGAAGAGPGRRLLVHDGPGARHDPVRQAHENTTCPCSTCWWAGGRRLVALPARRFRTPWRSRKCAMACRHPRELRPAEAFRSALVATVAH
jgi:hypothetical protein